MYLLLEKTKIKDVFRGVFVHLHELICNLQGNERCFSIFYIDFFNFKKLLVRAHYMLVHKTSSNCQNSTSTGSLEGAPRPSF